MKLTLASSPSLGLTVSLMPKGLEPLMPSTRCCAAHRQWLPGSEYGSEKALEGAGSLKQARDLLLDMDESKLEVLRSKGYEVYFAKVGKAGKFP